MPEFWAQSFLKKFAKFVWSSGNSRISIGRHIFATGWERVRTYMLSTWLGHIFWLNVGTRKKVREEKKTNRWELAWWSAVSSHRKKLRKWENGFHLHCFWSVGSLAAILISRPMVRCLLWKKNGNAEWHILADLADFSTHQGRPVVFALPFAVVAIFPLSSLLAA